MSYRKVALSFFVLLVFSLSSVAWAQNQPVDVRNNPALGQLSMVSGSTLSAGIEIREGALLQINGVLRRGIGSRFRVTWSDGSSEEAFVVCRIGSGCVKAIKGSQRNPDGTRASDSGADYIPGGGGSGSGSGSGAGTGSGSGSGGINPPGGCYGPGCFGEVGPVKPT